MVGVCVVVLDGDLTVDAVLVGELLAVVVAVLVGEVVGCVEQLLPEHESGRKERQTRRSVSI